MKFLSLKWKALTVTCTLFLTLFVGRAISTYWFFTDQLTEQRKTAIAQNKNIFNAVIKKSFGDLERHAAEVSSLQGMTEALFETNPKRAAELIETNLNEYWWRLQLEMDVTTIAIYDSASQPLVILGETNIPSSIVEETKRNEQPQYSIACYQSCYIYATSPILIEGVSVGTSVFAISFSTVILQYKSITGDDIAIVRHAAATEFDKPLQNNWRVAILAATDRERVMPVLDKAMNTIDLSGLTLHSIQLDMDDLFHSTPSSQDLDGHHHYELFAQTLSTETGSLPGSAIFISDITRELRSIHNLFLRSLIYDGIGLLILAACLLGILWRPMDRLRLIAMNIPLLATNSFQKFRQALALNTRHTGIMDESDALSSHAVELSHTLEMMQHQILERNAELEYQSDELVKEKDFITRLLDTAHAMIITHDCYGKIIMVNKHACDITGYTQQELIGQRFSILFPDNHLPEEFTLEVDNLLLYTNATSEHEADLRCKNGDKLFMSWYHSALPGIDTLGNQILTVALNITARKKAEDHLSWLANHDSLTGLFNRRKFNESLDLTLADSKENNLTAALMYVDLDKFKDINDTSGHSIGDELLLQVSAALRRTTRESDIVARLGGDEFAILLPNTSRDIASMIAQRICISIAAIEVHGEKHHHHGSCSVGIVMFPTDQHSSADVLADADVAMYNAKKSGRNNWCFYDSVTITKEAVRERVHWDELVKQAIEKNNIELFFQPILGIKQRHVDHYECLMRIRDNDKLIPPVEFIRAAEGSGLMAIVDEHIIRLAFGHKRTLEQHNIHCVLAINLSGLSFQSSNLAYHIKHCLEEFGINPAGVVFEITETTAVADLKSSKHMMQHLQSLGFTFALDDFGAGFSSLSYLKQFPIDFIKIDGAFVKDIVTDVEDQVLVKSIIETARAFHLSTIAEFVENQETLTLLEAMGVTYAQGYYIDKPKPFAQIWDLAALPEPASIATPQQPDQAAPLQ